jgi:hypothetical protein
MLSLIHCLPHRRHHCDEPDISNIFNCMGTGCSAALLALAMAALVGGQNAVSGGKLFANGIKAEVSVT